MGNQQRCLLEQTHMVVKSVEWAKTKGDGYDGSLKVKKE